MTITNCAVSGFVEGTFLDGTYQRDPKSHPTGRIKLGTESNGGFKNIAISNCTFNYCRGLALETVDGALLEDITISNITMRDICNAPIFLRLGARMRGPDSIKIGELKRVIISNIIAYNVNDAILITGIPGHDIKDVELSHIKLYVKGNGTSEQAKHEVAEMETGYPEPDSFGILPVYGIYARHVEGLKLEDIDLNYLNDDQRPAVLMNDVHGADLRFIKIRPGSNAPIISTNNSSGIVLFQSLNKHDGELK